MLLRQRTLQTYSPFLCSWGFREGVLPGVFLLSRCLLSGLPVLGTILLGPGFMLIHIIIPVLGWGLKFILLKRMQKVYQMKSYRQISYPLGNRYSQLTIEWCTTSDLRQDVERQFKYFACFSLLLLSLISSYLCHLY